MNKYYAFVETYFFGWGTTSRLLRVLKKSGPLGKFFQMWVILIDFDKI